jgi:hypothetical protein
LWTARPANGIICANPLISSDHEIVAILEFGCKFSGSPGDYDIIESFAKLTHSVLLKLGLKSIAAVGRNFVGIIEHFPEKAADDYITFIDYRLEIEDILKFDFNAKEMPLERTFQVVFALFDHFKLKEEFHISNRKLYSFLNRISARYRSEFYFNWNHAIEVCQFCAFQLSLIKFAIPKNEVLALFFAALCHDVDHDGFSEIPTIDSLYQCQSVDECHHIVISSVFLSDITIFHEDLSIWELFIDLVLATDMSKHFAVLDDRREKPIDLTDSEFRRYFLKLILKAADVSDCCRRWDSANQFREVVCEEFFQHGFLEGVEGLKFEGDRRDRVEIIRNES